MMAMVVEQIVEFDFGLPRNLNDALIWQMNQGGVFGALAPERGVDEFDILVSPTETGDNFVNIGTFNLDVETGLVNVPAQLFDIDGNDTAEVWRVRFDIFSAHNPVATEAEEFVGLSEVRFNAELIGDLKVTDRWMLPTQASCLVTGDKVRQRLPKAT